MENTDNDPLVSGAEIGPVIPIIDDQLELPLQLELELGDHDHDHIPVQEVEVAEVVTVTTATEEGNVVVAEDHDQKTEKKTKRTFTPEFKLKVVEYAERTNNNLKAAKHFGVDAKQVREWRKRKEEIESPQPRLFKRTHLFVEGGPGCGDDDDVDSDTSFSQVIKISPSDIENEIDDASNLGNDAFFDPDLVKEEPMSGVGTGTENDDDDEDDDDVSIYSSSVSSEVVEEDEEELEDDEVSPPKRRRRRNRKYDSEDFEVDVDIGPGSGSGEKGKSETDTDGEGIKRRSSRRRRTVGTRARRRKSPKTKRRERKPKTKTKKDTSSSTPREKRKRGRPKAPRRLDGTNAPTSSEEDEELSNDQGNTPVRTGSGYKVEFKIRVLKYAETHSNSATAEKFKVSAKRIREWKRMREKIGLEKEGLLQRRPRSAGLTVIEKLQAVEFAKERSTDEARLLYGVDRRTIEKWRANAEKLQERIKCGQGDALRDGAAGRKPRFTHIEDKLRDWVIALRLKGVTVNCKMILNKAAKLIAEETIPENGQPLKAPRTWSWVIGFLKRQNLMGMLGTTLGHEDPRELLSMDLKTSNDVATLAQQPIEIPENPNKRHRRSISLQDKINIINRIEKGETQGIVAKSLGVATSTVQTIWSCRNDILRKYLNPKQKPKSVAFLWKKYSVIASALMDWYEQCIMKSLQVDGKTLFEKAVQLSETYRLSEEFKQDSVEWFKQYCKRHKLMDKCNEVFPPTSSSSKTATAPPHPPLTSIPPSNQVSFDHSNSPDDDGFQTVEHEHELDFLAGFSRNNENEQKIVTLNTPAPHQPPPNIPHLTLVTHHQTQTPPNPVIQQTYQIQPLFTVNTTSSTASVAVPISTFPTTVTINDALKYLGYVRSWICANYGPNDVNLNHHLSSIENAIFKKRPN